MNQEDLNDMMRDPGEVKQSTPSVWNHCPKCDESYGGDGKALCLECSAVVADVEGSQ